MGPRDPFGVLRLSKVNLTSTLRKVTVVYGDGVEVEVHCKVPATGISELQGVWSSMPPGAHLFAAYTDEESDGRYVYMSFWAPCTGDCESCPASESGVTRPPCKLVEM